MDLDLRTQVRGGSAGRGHGSQLLSPGRTLQEAGSPGREPRRPPCPAHTWPHAGLSCCPHPASPGAQEGPIAPSGGPVRACLRTPLLYVGAVPWPRPRPRTAPGAFSKGLSGAWADRGTRGDGRFLGAASSPRVRSTVQPPVPRAHPEPPKAELSQAPSPVLGGQPPILARGPPSGHQPSPAMPMAHLPGPKVPTARQPIALSSLVPWGPGQGQAGVSAGWDHQPCPPPAPLGPQTWRGRNRAPCEAGASLHHTTRPQGRHTPCSLSPGCWHLPPFEKEAGRGPRQPQERRGKE